MISKSHSNRLHENISLNSPFQFTDHNAYRIIKRNPPTLKIHCQVLSILRITPKLVLQILICQNTTTNPHKSQNTVRLSDFIIKKLKKYLSAICTSFSSRKSSSDIQWKYWKFRSKTGM